MEIKSRLCRQGRFFKSSIVLVLDIGLLLIGVSGWNKLEAQNSLEKSILESSSASKSGSKKNIQIESMQDKNSITSKKVVKNSKKDPSQEDYYSVSNKSFSNEELEKADQLAIKTIRSINSLLKNKKMLTPSKEFELKLRLGELYSERHDYLQDKEIKDFEQRYDLWASKGSKGKAPTANYKKSRQQLQYSVNIFKSLVSDKRFVKESRMDSALYALGKSLSRLDDPSSVKYFEQLIKTYPKSSLVAEAYLATGDYYFEKNQPEKALASYKEVFRYKSHRVYPYAVYKSGWCYFNLNVTSAQQQSQNLKKAASSFKLVVSLSDKNRNKAGRIDLKQEAMYDLAMVFAELEDTQEAEKYFKRMKNLKSYYVMLERLANIYVDQGKYVQASRIYEKLVAKKDLSKTDPQYSMTLISLYEKIENFKKMDKELKSYYTRYVDPKSKWFLTFQSLPEAQKANTDYEYNLRKYATSYHKMYQQTKSKLRSSIALEFYSLYLTHYSTNPNAYTIRYYQAELYYDTGMYANAAKNYLLVAQDTTNAKYRQDSYLNVVYSYFALDESKPKAKLPPLGKVPSAIALPTEKVALIQSIDNYYNLYPKDKRSYPMIFTAANIYFVYGYYDESESRFKKIIETIPNTVQAQMSIKILASYYSQNKNWDKLEAFSRSMRGSGLKDKQIERYLTENIKLASFYKAQDLEKKSLYSQAARQYIQYQSEFSTDKNAERALYNASVCYYKASMFVESIQEKEKLLSSYPKTSLKKQVTMELAQVYEGSARYDLAAKYYESFYYNFPNDAKAIASLYNAATLYTGLKEYPKALKSYQIVAKSTKDKSQLVQTYWQIASIQEKSNMYKEAYNTYATLIKLETNPEASLYAQAHQLSLNKEHAINKSASQQLFSLCQRLGSYKKLEAYEARSIAGKYLLQEASSKYDDYIHYTITDIARLEKQITTKQQKLIKVASEYEKIMKLSTPEYEVASLYMLGSMHEVFAKNLMSLNYPSSYPKQEVEALKTEITKVASSLQDEAKKFYTLSYNKSQDLNTFSQWPSICYDKMAELDSQSYPETESISVDPEFLSFSMDSMISAKF